MLDIISIIIAMISIIVTIVGIYIAVKYSQK